MSYPSGCYRHLPNLRVRPVEEVKSCVVFRPKPPKLFMLNLNAWLIFSLCDGNNPGQLEKIYRQHVASRMSEWDVERNLSIGLRRLQEEGLIELTSTG